MSGNQKSPSPGLGREPASAGPVEGRRVDLRCPACLGRRVARQERREYAGRFLVIRPPLKCLDCGACFDAPCGWVLCGLTVAVGLAFAIPALLLDAWPALRQVVSGTSWLQALVDLSKAIVVAGCGVWLAAFGMAGARYSAWYRRAVQNEAEAPERH